ncbi:MAG: PilZ domain-containing protein [Proteobacteria bacterium]|nr:PilZ domain-containing protein [Pseudomonadota bacterium]
MREHVRVRRSFSVKYRMPWSNRWQTASTRDVSASGLSFILPKGLCMAGLPVEIEVDSPVASFRSKARVARTRRTPQGKEIGIAFGAVNAEAKQKLERYLYLAHRAS